MIPYHYPFGLLYSGTGPQTAFSIFANLIARRINGTASEFSENRSFFFDIRKLNTPKEKEKPLISRIEHVSIAVHDYDKAVHFFQHVLGAIPGAGMEDSHLKFYWQIFSLGDLSRLELIKPTGEESFLDNFMKNKKEGGVHHITLQTPDIQKAKERLEKENIPYFGFNDFGVWKEFFIHPKDAFGILIQIAQLNPDDYIDNSAKFLPPKRWSVQKTENGCCLNLSHPGGGKVEIELTDMERKALIKDLLEMD